MQPMQHTSKAMRGAAARPDGAVLSASAPYQQSPLQAKGEGALAPAARAPEADAAAKPAAPVRKAWFDYGNWFEAEGPENEKLVDKIYDEHAEEVKRVKRAGGEPDTNAIWEEIFEKYREDIDRMEEEVEGPDFNTPSERKWDFDEWCKSRGPEANARVARILKRYKEEDERTGGKLDPEILWERAFSGVEYNEDGSVTEKEADGEGGKELK